MIKHLRSLSKDSLIYGLGNASASVISFLLLPLYTRFLSPEDYGVLAVFAVYQSIIEITISFGLSSGLFRYYLMAESEEEKKQVLGTCFLIQAAFIVFLALVLFTAATPMAELLFKSSAQTHKLNIVTGTALLGALPSLFYALMRAERKTKLFASVQFGRTAVLAISNIILVAVVKMNYLGVIISNLGVSALLVLCLLPFFLKKFLAPISPALIRRILAFVAPVYAINVFGFLLSMSDRFFLNRVLSPDQVGLYSFGNKIGSVITIGLITPFSTAVVPYALSIAKQPDFKEVFARIIKYFALAAFFCSLPIFFFSKELILLIGSEAFIGSWGIVGPTLLAGVFYGLYYAVSIQLDVIEKTYLSSFAVAVGAAASVCLNLVLIPRLGMYGSALSACCANAILLITMFIFCQRSYPVPHEVGAFAKLLVLVGIAVVFFLWVESHIVGLVPRMVAKTAFLLMLPVPILLMGILNHSERLTIRRGILKLRSKPSE